jgi:hypothetical protein
MGNCFLEKNSKGKELRLAVRGQGKNGISARRAGAKRSYAGFCLETSSPAGQKQPSPRISSCKGGDQTHEP